MIIGIGIDLVDLRRIEHLLKKFGEKFIHKVFTEEERAYAALSSDPVRVYGNRFAAKEATAKALGTGLRGFGWKDIEVTRAQLGTPSLILHHNARIIFENYIPSGYIGCAHISFSDELPYSTAFVVLSAIPMKENF